MDKSKIKKIVLAYSGGLDTSVIIPWLKEHYNDPEIIAVAADVGQGDELDGLEEKAIKTGASKLIIADLTDEMCDEIIVPSVMMDAKYEKYLLGTAFARPVIGKKLAEIALARETIRFGLNWPSNALHPICRSSRRGESGKSSLVTKRSTMPRRIMCR